MNQEINNYISKRYNRWLDYSVYHCDKAGIIDQATDVLNEVLLSLLKKDEVWLLEKIRSKKSQYTEFDFYVLRSIKLNIFSPTSPYQSKYKPIQADANIDVRRLEIEDNCDETTDRSDYVLSRMHEIREVIEQMGFSDKAMEIFEFRFFQGGVFKKQPEVLTDDDKEILFWEGEENTKELYAIYASVMNAIRKKIRGELIF